MRRKRFGIVLSASCLALLCACTQTGNNAGTPAPSTPAQPSTTPVATADAVEYPITVTHAFGETVIESKPENIVSISWGNQDVPLALGVVPVGVSAANYGAVNEDGLHSWVGEKFAELGVEHPNVFNDTDGLDYEAISNAKPDVILAAYSGLTQEEYDLLSEIAPVVAYPRQAWQTFWREQVTLNAAGMGMLAEGEALVAQTDALIQSKLDEHPVLEGKTAAFLYVNAADMGTFYIYLPSDPRASYLMDLGLALPDSVSAMAGPADSFSLTVSAENTDKLNDIDIIVAYGDDTLLGAMQADKLMSQIPAVANGAVVLLPDTSPLAAACNPTVLSIQSQLDEYLTQLDKAASNVK